MKKIREPKERVWFNNYDTDLYYNDAKTNLINDNTLDCNYVPTEDEIWNEVAFMSEIEWDDFKDEFTSYIDYSNGLIITGYIERWNGKGQGGTVVTEFNEMYNLWKDCDYIKVYDENGHLYLKCSHHDGTNLYEIKELTKRGRNFYDEYCDYKDRIEFCPLLFGMNIYSRLPRIAEKIWGCKREEYV